MEKIPKIKAGRADCQPVAGLKMKKNDLASQFPNIYRRITEKLAGKKLPELSFRLPWQSKLEKIPFKLRLFIGLLVIIILTATIAYFRLKTYQEYAQTQQVLAQREQIQSKINFWQSIAQKYEGYKDSYFQMAVLYYQLGNFEEAKLENQKALSLDPNFEDARKLEEVLNK